MQSKNGKELPLFTELSLLLKKHSHTKLNYADVSVLQAIAAYYNPIYGYSFPTQQDIAGYTRLSRRSIQRSIKYLSDNKYIFIGKNLFKGFFQNNTYIINTKKIEQESLVIISPKRLTDASQASDRRLPSACQTPTKRLSDASQASDRRTKDISKNKHKEILSFAPAAQERKYLLNFEKLQADQRPDGEYYSTPPTETTQRILPDWIPNQVNLDLTIYLGLYDDLVRIVPEFVQWYSDNDKRLCDFNASFTKWLNKEHSKLNQLNSYSPTFFKPAAWVPPHSKEVGASSYTENKSYTASDKELASKTLGEILGKLGVTRKPGHVI